MKFRFSKVVYIIISGGIIGIWQRRKRRIHAKKLDQEVGTRLENIRKGKLHMTQEQLGEIIDRSVPTVRRYENGLSRVPDEIKVVLNNKLEINPEDLLLGESEIILTIEEEVSRYSDSRLLAYLQAISEEIAKRNKKTCDIITIENQ